MLKQTVLKFQGALGLLGFGSKEGGKDGDSGNSSATGFSDDDEEEEKDIYLSTGVLAPRGQPVSEIHVARYSTAQITALIDGYKAKRGNVRQLCRVFDTKELVSKEDAASKMPTKIGPEEVRALALDARRLVTARLSDIEEEKQSPRNEGNSKARKS